MKDTCGQNKSQFFVSKQDIIIKRSFAMQTSLSKIDAASVAKIEIPIVDIVQTALVLHPLIAQQRRRFLLHEKD
jgi:hypothetical protein